MKENPAPGTYLDHHATNNSFRPKGPTFGIGYKYYEKVTIPKEKKRYPQSSKSNYFFMSRIITYKKLIYFIDDFN